MKNYWFYIKYFSIGLLNSIIIIILAGLIYASLGLKAIFFIQSISQTYNMPHLFVQFFFALYNLSIITISSVPILLSTYLLQEKNITIQWKSIAFITSLSLLILAIFTSSYTSYSLILVILFNIYILKKISEKQLSKFFKPAYAVIALLIIYSLLIILYLNIIFYPHKA